MDARTLFAKKDTRNEPW